MADNKGSPVGQPLPSFTASYNGFAFNDMPANLIGTLAFATPATTASPPGAYAITPSGQSASNYSIAYVNGTLTLQPGTSAVAGDVLSSINAGARQLPPPFLSGPFEGEGGPQSLATHLLSAVQPSNVAGDAQVDGNKTGRGANERPLLSGAVKKLVSIVDGGAKAPDPGGTLAPLGSVR